MLGGPVVVLYEVYYCTALLVTRAYEHTHAILTGRNESLPLTLITMPALFLELVGRLMLDTALLYHPHTAAPCTIAGVVRECGYGVDVHGVQYSIL